MATAEELLAQMEENPELYADSVGPVNDVIVINAETRTIELPESEKIFGVELDKTSERKYFKCPKIVGDNLDLSAFNLFINFKNANNEADIYPIDDVEVDGDYITFSWLLSKKVTAYKTDASKNQLLSFIFCAKKGEGPDNEWNTTICSDGIVLEGLEPGESIAEDNPDIIQYILERLDSAGTITPEQISEAVEEYFASNPIEESDPTVPSWAKKETPDKTLSEEGKAADAKEVGDRLSQLSDEIANSSKNGLTTEQINALDGMFKVTAFSNDPTSAYNAFKTAFGITTESIPATSISLDKSTLSFTDSASQTLIATVEPSNSTDSVTWESSDTGIVTVSNGVVTPVSNGSCTITVRAGSYSASCEVTVNVSEEIVTLQSISATYTGGDVAVRTALTDLTGITVTATYSDGSTENVTGYSLSGEILEGENTITVSYGGLTTTFAVVGIVESGGDTTAELITDGLVGFWDFRNCDYSASTMPATVGNGKIVRFGGTSSDDYGIIANTAFAYNPDGDSGYTSFNKPFSLVGMGYSTDKGDVPTLWNYLIVVSNLNSNFGSVGKVKWYDISGNENDLSTVSGNTDIPINTLESGFSYFIISVDENNILKYYYQGEHVLTLDPVELGLTDFDHWNINTTYFSNYNRNNQATAVAIYNRAISEIEAIEIYAYLKTLEVA